ncbi:hypothetical protein V865_000089 [Kwoniella europaea PYCC6329]|uniref:Uncharacterized protein n=1 Tax=Kwoniella europaea PYCC6329 TaxID=1423913 RepID=A0AAX4K6C7_9TREE
MPCNGNSIGKADQRKITFPMMLEDMIVDLAKNLVMVREYFDDYDHVKLHIFKVLGVGADDPHELEYQGACVLDLGRCFEEDEDHSSSETGPDVYCLIDEVFILIKLPENWITQEATPPDTGIIINISSSTIPKFFPPTTETDVPLLYWSYHSPKELLDLPTHIRDKIPPSPRSSHQFRYSRSRQTESSTLEVLQFDLGLMVNDAIEGQLPPSDGDHQWTINSLQIPLDTPILESCRWWKYSFWTFDHTLPCDIGKRDRQFRVLTNEVNSRFTVLDFNPRILKAHPPLGNALGGLGGVLPIDGFVPESKVKFTVPFTPKFW